MARAMFMALTFGFLAAVMSFGSDPALAQHQLEILAPAPSQHLYTNQNTEILARLRPEYVWADQPVAVTIGLNSAAGTEVLASGDLRSAPVSDLISWVWNLSTVKPGRYLLTISLEGPDIGSVEAAVKVEVHSPPKASLFVEQAEVTEDGVTVIATVEAQSPENIAIERYVWNMGDGSPRIVTREPTVKHLYTGFHHTNVINVLVLDILGGETRAFTALSLTNKMILDLSGAAIKAPDSGCGCQKMVVNTSDTSRVYCSPLGRAGTSQSLAARDFDEHCSVLPPGQSSYCPAGHTAFACRNGGSTVNFNEPTTWLRFGFEVSAELTPGSKGDLCLEGQFARADFRTDGNLLPGPAMDTHPEADDWSLPAEPPTPPFEFESIASSSGNVQGAPHLGDRNQVGEPLWGADDYDAPRDLKRHSDTEVHWWDAPGLRVLTSFNSASLDAEFVSFVGDADSTDPVCWCRFSVKESWDRQTGTAPPPEVRWIDGYKCDIPDALTVRLATDGIDPLEAATERELRNSGLFLGPASQPIYPAPTGVPTGLTTPIAVSAPLVFVPGIMGSKLWLEGYENGHLWGYTHLVWPPLNPFNFGKISPAANAPVVADGLVPIVYDPLIGFLQSIGYRLAGPAQNLWIYAYDWRQSNATSGPGLKALIDGILASPAAQQNGWTSVDVIIHSMGGIVLRDAKKQGARVRKEVYLASPHLGAVESYLYLHDAYERPPPPGTPAPPGLFDKLTGNLVLHNLKRFLGDRLYRSQRDLAKEMPSTWELLPDRLYLDAVPMVVGVNGLSDHYFGANVWQFGQGNRAAARARRGVRYKDGLPLAGTGPRIRIVYSASEESRDTTDFGNTPPDVPTAYDSGLKGDGTVPRRSASRDATDMVTGEHKRIPNEQGAFGVIRNHLGN